MTSVRPEISHTKFSLLFSLLLYGICNAINIDKLARWFRGRDGVDYASFSAYLLAGLCLFIAFFLLMAHRRTIKPVAMVLVVVSAAVTYFIAKYDVAIQSSMVRNAIHTDATEVRQLLSLQMIPYVVFLVLFPLMVIALTDVRFAPSGTYLFSSLKLFSIALLVAFASLYSNYNGIHRAGNLSNKYIVYSLVPINFISGGMSVIADSIKPHLWKKKEVEISGRVAAPGNLVVVLAIGESSRRSNFSLYGYGRRNTNPVLQKIGGLQLLNGIAKQGSTLYALPEILEKNGVKLPAVVSTLGIPTACYVNYTLYDNCASVGETKVRDCGHGGKCYDEDVVPLLEENLKTYVSGYRFAVLHLGGGSHGPAYAARIPPEFRFEPMCRDADVLNECTVEQLYNAYDSTILYADYVLSRLVQTLERSRVPYVFIYLSDHGESLGEGGRMFHGMPPGVPLPPEQAEIPLIVKSSLPVSIVRRREYHQQDVFDTVVDLFSIETPMFETKRSFIRKAAISGNPVR